jgi:hypothetical protein
MRRVAVVIILILASCGGEELPAETFAPVQTLTSLTTTTRAPASADSSLAKPDPDDVEAEPTTTTTTLPPSAAPEFALSQVVFGDAAFVIITNWGDAAGSLDELWLSQGTAVQSLPDVNLAPAEQAVIGLAGEAPSELAGVAAIVDLGRAIGDIAPGTGEIALHGSDAFDDPASLIAYVAWGAGPHDRIDQAVAADLWDGGAVDVFDDAPSISTGVYPATQSIDWSADIGG